MAVHTPDDIEEILRTMEKTIAVVPRKKTVVTSWTLVPI